MFTLVQNMIIFSLKQEQLWRICQTMDLIHSTSNKVHIFTQPRADLTDFFRPKLTETFILFEKQETKAQDREKTSLWASHAHRIFSKI